MGVIWRLFFGVWGISRCIARILLAADICGGFPNDAAFRVTSSFCVSKSTGSLYQKEYIDPKLARHYPILLLSIKNGFLMADFHSTFPWTFSSHIHRLFPSPPIFLLLFFVLWRFRALSLVSIGIFCERNP